MTWAEFMAQVNAAAEKERAAAKSPTAKLLIGLAEAGELYHAPDGTAFADLTVHRKKTDPRKRAVARGSVGGNQPRARRYGHRETWAIRSG
jgi:hypothetical protein